MPTKDHASGFKMSSNFQLVLDKKVLKQDSVVHNIKS